MLPYLVITNSLSLNYVNFIFWSLIVTESDYYQLDDLLTLEEQAIRMKVREFVEKEVAPIMAGVFSLSLLKYRVISIFNKQKKNKKNKYVNLTKRFLKARATMTVVCVKN